jgi:hypothetical protein
MDRGRTAALKLPVGTKLLVCRLRIQRFFRAVGRTHAGANRTVSAICR